MPVTTKPSPDDNRPMTMTRNSLDNLPARVPLPPGILLRPMQGVEEAEHWTRIQQDAEPFQTIGNDRFARAFGTENRPIAARCFFAIDSATGEAIGTASGWHGGDKSARGAEWGRLHWVAVRTSYQRQGIARALVVHCLHAMAELGHKRAYLVTSTARVGAIALYESVGFVRDAG